MTETYPMTSEVRDFSAAVARHQFTIDGELFESPAVIPAQTLLDFSVAFGALDKDSTLEQQLEAFTKTLRLVLMPDSADRFIARMGDPERPISMKQVNEVIPWLLEQHGLRPTEPSEVSSDGSVSPAAGTPSTAEPQAPALTSVPSAPTGS